MCHLRKWHHGAYVQFDGVCVIPDGVSKSWMVLIIALVAEWATSVGARCPGPHSCSHTRSISACGYLISNPHPIEKIHFMHRCVDQAV